MISPGVAHNCCTFSVLGGVRAGADGDEVALPGQLRALLGILLADRDVAVSTDVIVERLCRAPTFPSSSPPSPLPPLSRYRHTVDATASA